MAYHSLLNTTEHRPWPIPQRPWVMTQTWHNLLFAHWALSPEVLRPLVPPCFPLDTFEGQAWVGVVPFRMSNIHFRHVPPIPFTHRFPELNLRTYVTVDDKPGVYFFSLDAANLIAVWTARWWFNLPYYQAKMELRPMADEFHYDSRRTHPGAAPAEFRGRYQPISAPYLAEPGTLDHWLTERYCLYTVDRQQRPYRGEIHHIPWPLQRATATIDHNTIATAAQISLPSGPPLCHYAQELVVLVWPLERI